MTGLDESFIYVNDPAFPDAPWPLSPGDFDLAWLGRDEFYAFVIRQE